MACVMEKSRGVLDSELSKLTDTQLIMLALVTIANLSGCADAMLMQEMMKRGVRVP